MRMKLKGMVEPLRDLYKDEVGEVAKEQRARVICQGLSYMRKEGWTIWTQ